SRPRPADRGPGPGRRDPYRAAGRGTVAAVQTTRPYRPGALAAPMDAYHRAAEEFCRGVEAPSEEEFAHELYPEDPTRAYRSIRTILRHVVASGYLYADYLRQHLGTPSVPPERHLATRADALS